MMFDDSRNNDDAVAILCFFLSTAHSKPVRGIAVDAINMEYSQDQPTQQLKYVSFTHTNADKNYYCQLPPPPPVLVIS
jgi:hypothetical protein